MTDDVCTTCDGLKVVSVLWPSGYPHMAPCPACCPDQKCCDAPQCPTPAAVAAWKKQQEGASS